MSAEIIQAMQASAQTQRIERLYRAAMEHCAQLNEQMVIGRMQLSEAHALIRSQEAEIAALRAVPSNDAPRETVTL